MNAILHTGKRVHLLRLGEHEQQSAAVECLDLDNGERYAISIADIQLFEGGFIMPPYVEHKNTKKNE